MALAVAMMAGSCPSHPPSVVFPPLSYRSNLPRVTVYPQIAMPGAEVIVVVRPLRFGPEEACLRVIDRDGFAWMESCGDTQSRRVPFRPSKVGAHIAYLYYVTADGPLHLSGDRAAFCVVGEDDNCP